jgi:hypothetical protein
VSDDWLNGAIDSVGQRRSDRLERIRANWIATEEARRMSDDAGRANLISNWSDPTAPFKMPAETIQRNLPVFQAKIQTARDLSTIAGAPKLHPWLEDPRNMASVRDNVDPMAATANWFGPPKSVFGVPQSDALARMLGQPDRPVSARVPLYQPMTTAQVLASLTGSQDTENDRLANLEANRPVTAPWTVAHGIGVDMTEGFRQVYYGMGMYLLDAMGQGDTAYMDEWKRAYQTSTERQISQRPTIVSPFGNAVYGGVSSFLQTAPALALAPLTDGTSLLAILGTQTGMQAYGKYRARGGTANEALLGGTLEGGIEAGTEMLPMGYLLDRFGKEGLGHFFVHYLGREMLGEQLATMGQDAADTAIANPSATWSQYWASRPEAMLDTAVATVMGSAAIGGFHGAYRKFADHSQDMGDRLTALAGSKFLDQAVSLAREAPLVERNPQAYADFLQGQAAGTTLENVYIPAEKVRSLFQDAGEDYTRDPFWSKYAPQIDAAAPIGGDVVIPIGEAVTHFSEGQRWETWRDSVRLSPGGVSLAESKAIETSHLDLMQQRGDEAAAQDQAAREQAAPAQRVYDEVLSQARQSGVSLNAARAYADLWTARYSARAAQQGTDAYSLFKQSVGGIVSELPESLRPYDRADSLDRLVNVMRRDQAAPSDKKLRGPSLLEFIAQRGGVEDKGGDLKAMGADRWHRDAAFRRKLLKETGDKSQGTLAGLEAGSTPNSQERVFEAAVQAGYFPELVGRETQDTGFNAKADLQTFHDAIDRELRGSPVYSEDRAAEGGTSTDAQLRSAADDLRGFLEARGIDPDKATPEEIKQAVADSHQDLPATRTFDQWRAWNVPPPGMAPDLVLHHNGPTALPQGRPQGMLANYFGTAAFSDAVGRDFGPWRYTFWVPETVASNIIDLGDRGEGVSQAGREFAAEVARRQWPDDPAYAEGLLNGDADAWGDFYETWADSANLQPLLEERGLSGARFGDEHLMLPDAIRQLEDRRNGPDDGSMSFYQSQPESAPFYSALTRAVETAKLTKGPAEQWLATLRNTSGVKAEEIEWSGLPEWLAEQPGQISRTDVQQFLRAGGIRVSEVVLGEYNGTDVAKESERLYEEWVERHTLQLLADREGDFPGIDMHIEPVDEGFRYDGWTYETEAEALEAVDEAMFSAEREWERDARRDVEDSVRRMRDPEDFDSEAKEALGALTHFADWTTTEAATPTYRELLITLPLGEGKNPKTSPDTHWSRPGVVAHTRFQAKRDSEGRPVLFVEEVQSDWHQKGRDEGYEVPAPPAVIEAARSKSAAAEQRWEAAQRSILAFGHSLDVLPADEAPKPAVGFEGFVLKDQPLDEQASYADVGLARYQRGEASYGRYPSEFDAERDLKITELRAEYRKARLANEEAAHEYAAAMRVSGIPQAPFKTTWPALVMKRVIRWAADHGYHSVAWTTGEQQAGRYNLSQRVGSVTVRSGAAFGDGLVVVKFGDTSVTDVLLSQGMAEGTTPRDHGDAIMNRDQLVKALGDLGGRIHEAGLAAGDTPVRFDAGDLEVGGEGMRAFYDRNLVNITNDIIKKYGAKVGKSHVLEDAATPDYLREAGADGADVSAMLSAIAPEQWSFEVTPAMAAAAQSGFSLFQGGESKPRGRIDFAKDGRAVIRLFEGRDLSTLLHEGAHLWLEELRNDAARPDAPQQVKDDWKTVKRWFRSNGFAFASTGTIPTDAHEMWARGMERYFMEGKAPTSSLARAFSSFRSWLLRIYKVVQNLNAPITDEVRGVMDRLIATDTEIAKAEAKPEQGLLFASAAEAGMTDAEFAAYKASAATVRSEAFDALLFRTMETIRRQRTAEWKRERSSVRAEVEQQVRDRPEFKALALLRNRDPEKRMQLNREAFVNDFGSDALAMMPRGVPPTVVDKGGVHPDVIAEQVGFKSGQDMVDMLIGVETRQRELRASQDRRSVLQETIDLGTDQAMRERHGDPLSDGSIEEEALAAIHSDKRAEIIASEIRYLARRKTLTTGVGVEVPTPVSIARAWAENKVREGKVSEEATAAALLRHQRNEAKAARAAQEAILSGNVDAAFVEKQRQLYHNELYRAAKKAKDEIDAIVRRLGKYAKSRSMPSMDADYLGQIHGLLEAYDFRPVSQAALVERQSFRDWARAKEEAGEEVYVPPRLADFQKVNFKDATVEDLIGLDDAVASVAHLGRRKKKLLLAKQEADFEEVVAEAVESVERLPALPVSSDRNPKPSIRSRIRGLDSTLIKIEFLADELDGQNPNGVFNRLLVRGAQDAASEKTRLVHEVVKPLADLYNEMPKAMQRRLREKITINELVTRDPNTGEEGPTAFDRSEILAIALNTGNESNLSKMISGESRIVSEASAWTHEKVQVVLDREMTQEDWQFVEKVWRQVDSLWPAIVAAEREISGVVPEKVEPRIVQTKFGPINGGYYPVVYDPTRSAMAEANYDEDAAKMLGQMGRVISTPKGHTITRTAASAPLMLSLEGVLLNHINRVTTRIAYGRYVRDTLKFISHPKIRDVFDRKVGREYRDQLKPWLQRQVNDAALDTKQLRAIDRMMRRFRVNATMVGLGFRFTTMAAQTVGMTNSIKEIGAKYAALGVGDTVRNLGSLRDIVFEKSPMMAERAQEFDRDVRTFFSDLSAHNGPLDRFRAMAYWGIGNVQLFTVDMPTWFGGYRKGLDEGMTEDEAIAYGDKVVRRSQSSGRAADLSALQDASEGYRVMTMFYSFWNVFYNQQREAVHAARSGDWRRASMNVFWIMMAGPVLSALVTGDWPDDDSDESWFHWAMRKMFFGLWAGLPIVREMAQGAERESIGKRAMDAQTPIARAADAIAGPLKDAYKVSTGDAPSNRWVQHAVTAPGYFFGLPTGQLGSSSQYLYDVAEGNQNPQGVGDVALGIMKGPQKSQEGSPPTEPQ